MDINRVTVVTDGRPFKDYQRGDIGHPLIPVDDSWNLCCPGCGLLSYLFPERIETHEDKTLST